MTRRITVACLLFAFGIGVGDAVLRPGHPGLSKRERDASAAVAAASGADVLRVTCVPDHCGVVVRKHGARTCQGWIVPLGGPPKRAALAVC